jgi:CheY-like chemotaxis protein
MTSSTTSAPIEILLVEDDAGDVLLIQEAFEDPGLKVRLSVARDGAEALAVLRKEAPHGDAPDPDLVLLDLNLPKVPGGDVLVFIKGSERLRHIPVVVLTTSSLPEDVLSSYRRHANAYVTKPVDLDAFVEAVRKIDRFFTSLASLPRSA